MCVTDIVWNRRAAPSATVFIRLQEGLQSLQSCPRMLQPIFQSRFCAPARPFFAERERRALRNIIPLKFFPQKVRDGANLLIFLPLVGKQSFGVSVDSGRAVASKWKRV